MARTVNNRAKRVVGRGKRAGQLARRRLALEVLEVVEEVLRKVTRSRHGAYDAATFVQGLEAQLPLQ